MIYTQAYMHLDLHKHVSIRCEALLWGQGFVPFMQVKVEHVRNPYSLESFIVGIFDPKVSIGVHELVF